MDKITELKNRIYAHNPELKELSFGCEYLDLHQRKTTFINKCGTQKHRCLTEDGMYDETLNIFMKETLGHPIHLDEIIYALREQDNYENSWLVELCGGKVSLWDYKKGGLDKQDKQTIQFLYEKITQ